MNSGKSPLFTPSPPAWITPASGGARYALGERPRGILPVTDDEAVEAFEYLSNPRDHPGYRERPCRRLRQKRLQKSMAPGQVIVINISGRGDKDVASIARYKGVEIYE